MQKSFKTAGNVYFALCKSVDTPRSLACWLLYKYGEDRQLVELDIRSSDYDSAYSFGRDLLVTSYFSKAKFLRTKIDTKEVATLKFLESEAKCKATNDRFRKLKQGACFPNMLISQSLWAARRKIAKVLGPCHKPLLLAECRWGPGATSDIRKDVAFAPEKYSKVLTTTPRALGWIKPLVESSPVWLASILQHEVSGPTSLLPKNFRLVDESRTVVVPKNAKSGRTITAEPTANSYLQQGAGRYMRRRLKRFGIDLDNQEINQTWASLSHSLDLATLDLSAASDTVSKELVFFLLPLDWSEYLNDLRCDAATLPGKHAIRLEKFSSMGNAFTFELETLIFWALVSSVQEYLSGDRPLCSVYGDDIICRASYTDEIIEVLEYCGFSINMHKSHIRSRYFESCGGHYYDGINITPVYQKDNPDETLESLISAGNRLIRHSLRLGHRGVLDGTCHAAYRSVARSLSERGCSDLWIPLGPDGDDGLCRLRTDAPMRKYAHGAACCRVTRGVSRYQRANPLGYLTSTLSDQGPVGLQGRNQLSSRRSLVRNRWIVPSEYFDWVWPS